MAGRRLVPDGLSPRVREELVGWAGTLWLTLLLLLGPPNCFLFKISLWLYLRNSSKFREDNKPSIIQPLKIITKIFHFSF